MNSSITKHLSLRRANGKPILAADDDSVYLSSPQNKSRFSNQQQQQSKSIFYTNDDKTRENEYIKAMQQQSDANQSKSRFYLSNREDKKSCVAAVEVRSPNEQRQQLSGDGDTTFVATIKGEDHVVTLPTVKCIYSAVDLNHENKYDEYVIKGTLRLTTFKLQFTPHKSEAKSYQKCFNNKKQYFKYWNENDIPLTFIYGIYNMNDKSKRLSANDIVTLTDQKPKDILIKCKNFCTKHFAFNNENYMVDKYGDFLKFLQSLLLFSQPQLITNLCLYRISMDSHAYNYSGDTELRSSMPPPLIKQRMYFNTSDLEQDLEESRCKSMMDVVMIPRTYPFPFVVPKKFLDFLKIDLVQENRIPVWSFTYENGCSIMLINESAPVNKQRDEEILRKYNSSIFQAQKILEGSSKVKEEDHVEEYMKYQVPIKAYKIASSFEKLVEICAYKTTNEFLEDDDSWNTRLHNTKWLKYVSKILEDTKKLIGYIHYKRVNIYIEEKYPKDISCVLTSLTQVFLYKKYRTIVGFQNLIQKEWFLNGHMFSKRLGLVNTGSSPTQASTARSVNDTMFYAGAVANLNVPGSTSSYNPSMFSTDSSIGGAGDLSSNVDTDAFTPIFLLFLDCVYQAQNQYPTEFEFNEVYLTTLYDYCLTGVPITFTFNGVDDWFLYKNEVKNTSYLNYLIETNWKWSTHLNIQNPEQTLFANRAFKPLKFDKSTQRIKENRILDPSEQIYELKFWSSCYLRWYNLNPEEDLQSAIADNRRSSIQELAAKQRVPASITDTFAADNNNRASMSQAAASSFAGTTEHKSMHFHTNYNQDLNATPTPTYKIITRKTPDGNIESTL